jgi:hypothetical protein
MMTGTDLKANSLKIDPRDNVATVLAELKPGDLSVFVASDGAMQSVTVRDAIPYGHKVALHRIGLGQAVVKYGAPIGDVTKAIEAGAHVHLHNLASRRMGGHA